MAYRIPLRSKNALKPSRGELALSLFFRAFCSASKRSRQGAPIPSSSNCLMPWTIRGSLSAICFAMAIAESRSSGQGTSWLSRPMRSASSALIGRPV